LYYTPTQWIAGFGTTAGWTSQNLSPRTAGDVNADGRADVVAFGTAGVTVSLANAGGTAFQTPSRWSTSFGSSVASGGWTSQDALPRILGDVNGDGRADAIGFATNGVWVANSTGTAFSAPTLRSTSFGSSGASGGWTSYNTYPRFAADVNNDGRADMVGFGGAGAVVALSNGTNFGTISFWTLNFGTNPSAGSWTSQTTTPRFLADVNADGRADIVGFGTAGVYVALSTGTAFGAPQQWSTNFGSGAAAGSWTSQTTYPRYVADTNNDGRADIVGFGANSVLVSLSTGTSFAAPALLGIDTVFTPASGWTSNDTLPRVMGDTNADHKADIIGFWSSGVQVSLHK